MRTFMSLFLLGPVMATPAVVFAQDPPIKIYVEVEVTGTLKSKGTVLATLSRPPFEAPRFVFGVGGSDNWYLDLLALKVTPEQIGKLDGKKANVQGKAELRWDGKHFSLGRNLTVTNLETWDLPPIVKSWQGNHKPKGGMFELGKEEAEPLARAGESFSSGAIITKKDWARLWSIYRGEEKLPDVDFDKHLVLIHTDLNVISPDLRLTEKGDLRTNFTRGAPVTDFFYQIVVIDLSGVRTINGRPLEKK